MSDLNLAYIGGLGLMASPAAKHLSANPVAKVVAVHDRGTSSPRHEQARASWQAHGAALCPEIAPMLSEYPVDGTVVCCGKNGDDLAIISETAKALQSKPDRNPFIVHLSTVSAEFVTSARDFCSGVNVTYCNYPLTGGPLGAEAGGRSDKGMLILCSGDKQLYDRLLDYLKVIGRPKYFGEEASKGAETKLIGHFLVYNGLIGISSALALHTEGFSGELGTQGQVDYFDFLIQGAGGTRQWEIAARKGIADKTWDQGFLLPHAVIDALYAAKLAVSRALPRIIVQPMIEVALAFSYVINRYPTETLGTHAIVREMLAGTGTELDNFMNEHGRFEANASDAISKALASLPEKIQQSAYLDVQVTDFASA